MRFMTSDTPASTDTIVCPLFPWYSRLNYRFSGLAAMLLVFGLWFFIDGTWRYRTENTQVAQRDAYMKQVEVAKDAGALDAWIEQQKSEGLKVSTTLDTKASNIADILWASHAAQRGWPEKPKLHSEEEIAEQLHLANGMFIGLTALLIYVFLLRNRQLVGHADHLITPNGKRMAYADAFRIDKRKWDKQGLAYVFYREGAAERKAVIDDLQYEGAGRVLEQLLAGFHGELIEKLPDEEAESEVSESSSDTSS